MRHPCELTLTYVKRPGTDFAVTKNGAKIYKRLVCSTKCNMRYDVLVRVLPFRPLKFFNGCAEILLISTGSAIAG